MPYGLGTMISHFCDEATELHADDVIIIAPADVGEEYARRIETTSEGRASIKTPKELDQILHGFEPSDLLLLIDTRYWPVEGFDLAGMVKRCMNGPWALHAVADRSNVDAAREYVRMDDRGFVRMVRRYYDGVTWSETGAIPYSVVPAAAVEDVAFSSLADLRSTLAERGMLSQDVPVCSGIADLTYERTFLAFVDRVLSTTIAESRNSNGSFLGKDVLVGRGCTIHSSARIVGPVIVQDDVTIEKGVTIVGPAVIGAGSIVQANASIMQSTLAGGSTLASEVQVRHSLICGSCTECPIKQRQSQDTPVPTSIQTGDPCDIHTANDQHGPTQFSRWVYQTTKLTIDTTVATVALLLLSPITLIVMILVKLDSPGPIFFGHEREGKDGKIFRCWKFRTMVADAHKKQRELYKTNKCDGPQFKLDHDPRITRVGGWLRATNLDEIPQLFNVLKGEMSIVGPRPSPFRENQICIPWRRARLSVRPGITGLWQVCRHDRESGDFHQWIAYDMKYVTHASLWVDFKIVLATFLTLGGQRNVPEHWIIGHKDYVKPLSTRNKPTAA